MINLSEVVQQLAALFYYQSPASEKGVSFESLDEEKRAPFISLAEAAILNLDKINITLIRKSTKNQSEAEALLHDRIESEVKCFFDNLKTWKKGMIPQDELVARIFSVWRNL